MVLIGTAAIIIVGSVFSFNDGGRSTRPNNRPKVDSVELRGMLLADVRRRAPAGLVLHVDGSANDEARVVEQLRVGSDLFLKAHVVHECPSRTELVPVLLGAECRMSVSADHPRTVSFAVGDPTSRAIGLRLVGTLAGRVDVEVVTWRGTRLYAFEHGGGCQREREQWTCELAWPAFPEPGPVWDFSFTTTSPSLVRIEFTVSAD